VCASVCVSVRVRVCVRCSCALYHLRSTIGSWGHSTICEHVSCVCVRVCVRA